MSNATKNYPWQFQRLGGLDQVLITSAEDIAHLDELDPKLWVALSCPASGLEFDTKTLSLLDLDKDDRIRIPDVIAAVKWLKSKLIRLDSLIDSPDKLPLSAINTETDDGKRLFVTVKAILKNINKTEQDFIAREDLDQSTLININNLYNGDGIIPPTDKIDADLKDYINDAIKVMGGVLDASGLMGIDNAISQAFKQSLVDWMKWHTSVGTATTPLGENTAEIWQLIEDTKDKINDYFLRTELASYAPQAQSSLNVDEKYIVPTDNGLLDNKTLAELPLSNVSAQKPLSFNAGLNPIWRDKIVRLAELIKPFLADANQMTREEWLHVQSLLAPYSQAVLLKPKLVDVTVTQKPTSPIDQLGADRINQILNSDLFERFAILAEKDSKTPAAAADVADVEKLVLFNKYFYRLLMNFVSFHDFYDFNRKAAFESGKLFIDGRCCLLCIPVTDVAKHTVLSTYSELYLLYCECKRKNPPVTGNDETRTIVAAMTAGDADFLLEGRNGVFVDNDNNNWDAKVVKIITKPISLMQAIWDPYKRIGRFITDQVNKWASSKDSTVMNAASNVIQAPATEPAKFDISKSAGIFAAFGLAIGAIGTAVASIAHSLFQLQWWQLPLVFLGLFLIISGPSVILAWLKLRQRTLAPLLEASGWAINGKVKINFFIGNLMTLEAELPKNASRTLVDPTRKRFYRYWAIFFVAIFLSCFATGVWIWKSGYFDTFEQTLQSTTENNQTPPPSNS
ncbi:hypothetical protein RCS94_05870 [Orbaceae bacterium ac157xtp]